MVVVLSDQSSVDHGHSDSRLHFGRYEGRSKLWVQIDLLVTPLDRQVEHLGASVCDWSGFLKDMDDIIVRVVQRSTALSQSRVCV